MKEIPRISESEWEVMKVLWSSNHPRTANEISEILVSDINWSPKTVRTLITRLVDKQAVGIDQSGKSYLYFPLIDKEQGLQIETRSFLKRMKGIGLKPILAQFINEQKLSEQDIMELRKLLDQRGR
ncbi:BlaI/MecI/CopY family transcriptional regulator [Paenibacillus sp. J2TS4]|uniref:BlaI/MecI/CopY family transcriptional regulator n=1 Tax=Paenibacillus sp. J2TS4 TaxID=2807194 RepID=UPI001B0E5C8B|nr:BlaI/MecI/CopY family transcriptional regulator [Paenibacillus sp. J2TS4]GIP34415.1 beta-lactamase repressor [Paenibacillus sp. J2TS4]